MKNKNIFWTIIGAICSIGSCISACALFENKRTEMNRQVNDAVDKRFKTLIDSAANNTNNQ